MAECELLGDSFGYFVQVMLGVIAMMGLWWKRHKERPQRPVFIWSLDASKQAMGAGFIHIFNMTLSIMFGHSESAAADPCAWYFITVMIDLTLGVVVLWLLLVLAESASSKCGVKSLRSGDYGTPPQLGVWGKQLLLYMAMVWLCKVLLAVVMFAWRSGLEMGAAWCLSSFDGHPHLELTLVMLGLPLFSNICQFWVIDSWIKMKPSNKRKRYRKRKMRHEGIVIEVLSSVSGSGGEDDEMLADMSDDAQVGDQRVVLRPKQDRFSEEGYSLVEHIDKRGAENVWDSRSAPSLTHHALSHDIADVGWK